MEATVVVPALTTVRQPLAELGRTAVSVLLRQLSNRQFEPLRIELETRLVLRDSTGVHPGKPGPLTGLSVRRLLRSSRKCSGNSR